MIGTLCARADEAGIADLRGLARPRRLPARVGARLPDDDAARRRPTCTSTRPSASRPGYGIPPGCRARLHRPQGRHRRRHRGRARHRRQDRRRPARALSARSRASTSTSTQVAGEKRRQTLIEHREDAERESKQLGTIERDLPELAASTWPTALADRARPRRRWRSSSAASSSAACCARIDELEAAVPGAADRDGRSTRSAPSAGGAGRARRRCSPTRRSTGLAGDGPSCSAWRSASEVLVVEEARRRARRAGWPTTARSSRTTSRRCRDALPARPACAPAFDTVPGRLPDRAAGRTRRVRPRRPARRAGPRGGRPRRRRRRRSWRAAPRARCVLREPLAARLEEREPARAAGRHRAAARRRAGAMEDAGVAIDPYRMGEIAARVADAGRGARADRRTSWPAAPFTLGSPKQLGEVLFERLGLPADRSGKTGYSTDSRVLAKLRDMHPIIAVVEQLARALEAALDVPDRAARAASRDDGRIHTTFSQTTAATGRLSSTNPNLQNIPIRTPLGREIRAPFVPRRARGCSSRRLLAGRAAHPRAPVGRGRCCARPSSAARTCTA